MGCLVFRNSIATKEYMQKFFTILPINSIVWIYMKHPTESELISLVAGFVFHNNYVLSSLSKGVHVKLLMQCNNHKLISYVRYTLILLHTENNCVVQSCVIAPLLCVSQYYSQLIYARWPGQCTYEIWHFLCKDVIM